MSDKLLIKEAKRRRMFFKKLDQYLCLIYTVVKKIDPSAKVYLFGSVAQGTYLLSSDIDILIISRVKPEIIISRLWREGIEDPFEIHVVTPEYEETYRKRSRLISLSKYCVNK